MSKKYYPQYKTWKTCDQKYTGKIIGPTYCLGCKNYTDNFKPQEIKMTNKVLREKSNCVACRSNKSRFLKQKHNSKKESQQQHKLSNSFFKLQKHAYVL